MIKEDIDNLVKDLSEDRIVVSEGLIKAKMINNTVNNQELTDFINGELNGKYNDKTLPEYRLILGETIFEFKSSYYGTTDIRKIPLPESTHYNGKSTNYRPIFYSVSEIEDAVNKNSDNEFLVTFTTKQSKFARDFLKPSMQNNQSWQLVSACWSFSPTSFPGILFQVKQRLIDILLEINNSIVDDSKLEKVYLKKSRFDASFEISQIISKAKKTVVLIDGYVDGTTLKLLSAKTKNVFVQILTDPQSINDTFEVLIEKFNKQYHNLEVKTSTTFHDRFLIIDNINYYQIGASLKDLGNKTFSLIRLKEKFMIDALKIAFNQEWDKK